MSVLIIWSLIFNVKCYEVADAGEGVGFFLLERISWEVGGEVFCDRGKAWKIREKGTV